MDQISVYVAGIIFAYTAFLLSIMSPGPNILAIMGTSMSIGRSSGLALALGVACWACRKVPRYGSLFRLSGDDNPVCGHSLYLRDSLLDHADGSALREGATLDSRHTRCILCFCGSKTSIEPRLMAS